MMIRIGIVTSRFNPEITSVLKQGALQRLGELGIKTEQILAVDVPGAYEIPLAAKWLLEKQCDAVLALGAVIRGETPHFDYVCQAVERGCSTLALEFSRPVVFGVLTTDNEEQAVARIGGAMGHKGREAAEVAIEMIKLRKFLDSITHTQESPHDTNRRTDHQRHLSQADREGEQL
jgi:6,7-dimethyl-8-ribityllumazine synthase